MPTDECGTIGRAVNEAAKHLVGEGNESVIYFRAPIFGASDTSAFVFVDGNATDERQKEAAIRAVKQIMKSYSISVDEVFAK